MRGARPPIRGLLALALALPAIVAGCGSSAPAVPAAGNVSALLTIYQLKADVREHGQSPFLPATDHQPLALDDTVRTDSKGFAEIDYPDGSLTRLDVNTTFTVTQLVDTPEKREVDATLDIGRAWNRVEKLSGSDRFSITTPDAVATVRGTVFTVACDASKTCTFVVYEGSVEVKTISGQTVVVDAGSQLEVAADGTPGGRSKASLPTSDPWLLQNVKLDAGETPSASSSTPSGPPGNALHVHAKASTAVTGCVAAITVRWTADKDAGRFTGDAIVSFSADDENPRTRRAPWTGGFLQMTFKEQMHSAILTFRATLVSVGGIPVAANGATVNAAGSDFGCS